MRQSWKEIAREQANAIGLLQRANEDLIRQLDEAKKTNIALRDQVLTARDDDVLPPPMLRKGASPAEIRKAFGFPEPVAPAFVSPVQKVCDASGSWAGMRKALRIRGPEEFDAQAINRPRPESWCAAGEAICRLECKLGTVFEENAGRSQFKLTNGPGGIEVFPDVEPVKWPELAGLGSVSGNFSQTSSFCPLRPTPTQLAFLALPDPCVFVGGSGSRGFGQTTALLMAALQYAHIPGYKAVLVQKYMRDITAPSQLFDLARRWLDGKATMRNDGEDWIFPSGATLSFARFDCFDGDRGIGPCGYGHVHFLGIDQAVDFERMALPLLRLHSDGLIGSGVQATMVPVRVRVVIGGDIGQREWVKTAMRELPAQLFSMEHRLEDNPYLNSAGREKVAKLTEQYRVAGFDPAAGESYSATFQANGEEREPAQPEAAPEPDEPHKIEFRKWL